MQYGFNCRVAELYGVNEAVFIQSIYWWIQKNEAGGRHFHDGRSWTYDTMDKLLERFPFWSKRQLERIIQKLRDNGAVNYRTKYKNQGLQVKLALLYNPWFLCIKIHKQVK